MSPLTETRKKLLFCTHEQFWPLSGGCTAGNFNIMKYLSENNFDVTVSTPLYVDRKNLEAQYKFKLEPFSPFYMHRKVRFRMLRYCAYSVLHVFHLLRLLRKQKYDIIYVNNAVMAFPFLFLKPFLKAPVVIRYTDFLSGFLYEDRKYPRFFVNCLRSYECRISRVFDKAYVITDKMKEELCRMGGVAEDKVVVSFDGVDGTVFDRGKMIPSNREEIRAQLDIPAAAKVVMCHGTIEPHHGEYILPEIVRRLTEADANIYFLLIGLGRGYSAMKRKLVGNDRVRTLDFVDYQEIPKYIDASDAGIVPYPKNHSMDLVLTLKLLEYLSMGTPCVLFDLASVRDVFGKYEFVKISKDIKELVNNTLLVLESSRSKEAVDLIQQQFTWNAVAKNISQDLSFLIKKHSRFSLTPDLTTGAVHEGNP